MLINVTIDRIWSAERRRAEVLAGTGYGCWENPIQVALRIQTGGFWQMTRFEAWATDAFDDYQLIPEAERWDVINWRWNLPPEATAFIDAKPDEWQPFSFEITRGRRRPVINMSSDWLENGPVEDDSLPVDADGCVAEPEHCEFCGKRIINDACACREED